jgi:hypothetical protein
MDIFIETGETARLLKMILPKSYRTSDTYITEKRLRWIISLMEKETKKPIKELC